MNDNPEGTPNPLNPAPEAPVAAEPVAAEPVAAEPAVSTPAAEPVSEPTKIEPVAPAAPKKKGKAGIIIGIILGLVAIGCGVAAILIFFVFNKGGDQITDAMTKLLNGDNRNIAISGSYTADESTSMPISFDYNAQIDTVAKAGIVNVNISGNLGGMDLNSTVEARLPGDDKAYLKIGGIKSIFTKALNQNGANCEGSACDAYLEMMISSMKATNPQFGIFASLIELDDKWIMFDNATISSMFTLPTGMKLDDISSHKNEVVDTYKKYPFLKSSTNDLKIAKKSNTLYRVEFDYDKLASFTNELANKNGSSSNVTADSLKQSMEKAGDVYVEIDGSNNFTRFYAGGQDFDISYPSSVNVVAPSDYTTSETLIELLGNMITGFSGLKSGSTNIIDDDYDYDYDYDEDDDDSILNWSWDDDED